MVIADSAKHEDRFVSRRCDICGLIVQFECYPRTGTNQQRARRKTSQVLAKHINSHSSSELRVYVKRTHQVH
jgi:hypothetical protein